MWAAVRHLGSQIWWDGCDIPENYTEVMNNHDDEPFIDHTCNTLDDLKPMNCKLFDYELGNHGM